MFLQFSVVEMIAGLGYQLCFSVTFQAVHSASTTLFSKSFPCHRKRHKMSQTHCITIQHMLCYTTHGSEDVSLQPLILSLRHLLHLGRRCQCRPQKEVVQAALSGYLHFLPPLSKQAVLRMMQQAMKGSSYELKRDH